MIGNNNISQAWESIKKAKLRNLMTMFGIILGVVGVVTTVGIGEGVKKQITGQINDFGTDLIIVRPGRTVNRDTSGNIVGVNFLSAFNANVLTDADVDSVRRSKGVRISAPLSIIDGVPSYDNKNFPQGVVIGTNGSLPELLNHKVAFGEFITDGDEGQYFAVVGKNVAEKLFEQNVPLGKSISFRGKLLVVKGVFDEFKSTPFSFGADLNDAIFIPYTTSKSLSQGSSQVFQLLAKPTNPKDVDSVQKNIHNDLLAVHAGQDDFTVLKQDETLAVTSNVLNILTALVAGIAAISLIVGGVGIMNVMLVSVTERTHEIGIRKAIGATNRQIMTQFMVESMMISVVGSIIGVLCSLVISFLLRVLTDLKPVVSLPVIGIAILVSVVAGVIFGVAPAVKAARKDPIEALRGE